MSMTRQQALDKVRQLKIPGTKRLVEQGMGGFPSLEGDVDFWAVAADRDAVAEALLGLGAIHIFRQDHPAWTNHDVFVIDCSDGSLVVDVKFGDLRVGKLKLMRQSALLASVDDDQRFKDYARIADLLIRRMARGKPVNEDRLAASQATWSAMPEESRGQARADMERRFGLEAAAGIVDLLEGREPALDVPRSMRMQTVGSSFSRFSSLGIAVSRVLTNAIGWLTRRPRPYGRYPRGLLVVVSGTDGTGKSTTLQNVSIALRKPGFRCREYYLGRGRGNLAIVDRLRSVVSKKVQNRHDTEDVYRSPTANTLASWV